MTGRIREVGTFELDLPPDQAFGLFTARGEQDWADGWAPAR